jgi:hypothetical protein
MPHLSRGAAYLELKTDMCMKSVQLIFTGSIQGSPIGEPR